MYVPGMVMVVVPTENLKAGRVAEHEKTQPPADAELEAPETLA